MNEAALLGLLDEVAAGRLAPDDAVRTLRTLPYRDLGYAKVDHHRVIRQGIPEVVYGPGKAPGQVAGIVRELVDSGATPVLATRVDDAQAAAALDAVPGGRRRGTTVWWRPQPRRPDAAVVLVTAGTADGPVADECEAVLEALGLVATRIDDVGVAGLHRLLAQVEPITSADAVVVVAGMEGALASVVGGLTGAPVIAVPTSVGYGAGLAGVTALLGMLASCAAGLTVVGIDNGFGAACAVARLLGGRP